MARIPQTLLASVLAALALSAAATAGGPVISAGYGCAVSCIQSALVTPTASSASVEVKTSVPASVTVTVARVGASPGYAAGPAPKHVSVPPFVTTRTVLVAGLEPETSYRIVVSARDLQGRAQTRSGTFTTRAVEVAVQLPDLGLSSGLGCKADCIEQGTLTSDDTVPGRARLVLRSAVPATFQVSLVAKTLSGKTLHFLQHVTGSRKTEHTATLDRLLTGTTYQVTAKATDAEGRTHVEKGTFRTRSAEALVFVHKITIVDDADNGPNAGEIDLDLVVEDDELWSMGFRRIDSGTSFAPKMPGTSRPGVWTAVSVDRRSALDLAAGGVECDWRRLSGCLREAGSVGHDWEAVARASIDLRAAFVSDGSLPPGYGTGLPAGHDAYAIFETTDDDLKFRVYATVDVRLV